MNRARNIFYGTLVVLILVLILFGRQLYEYVIDNYGIVAIIYSVFHTAITYYYSKNEKFYLLVNKYIIFWFKHQHSKWKFFCELEGVKTTNEEIKKKIITAFGEKAIIESKSLDNFLEIVLDDEIIFKFDIEKNKNGTKYVKYRTSKFTVPWNKYEEKISLFTEIFNQITLLLQPDKTQYQISLFFEKQNPYFGFFIRYLPVEMVNSFNCQFRSQKTGTSSIRASKNKITIDSNKTESLRKNAIDYLTLNDTLLTK